MSASEDFARALDKALTDCGQRGQMERWEARQERRQRTVLLAPGMFAALSLHAQSRKMSVSDLVTRIVDAVAGNDELIGILLDEEARA